MTQRLHIEDLRRGEIATIVAIDRERVDPENARQLHEMGFDEGVDVELLHRAPFGGDPIALRVGNMSVALRKRLARMVVVERAVVEQPDAGQSSAEKPVYNYAIAAE